MAFLQRDVDYLSAFIRTRAQGDGAFLLNVLLKRIERDLAVLFTLVRALECGRVEHFLDKEVNLAWLFELTIIVA